MTPVKSEKAKRTARNRAASPEKYKKYAQKYMQKRRAWLDELKSAPCADCGKLYHPCVMDFDHVRGEKLGNISAMIRAVTMGKLSAEIAKCELVCSNCHRLRTHLREWKAGNRRYGV